MMPDEHKAERGWSKEYPSLRYGSWFWLRHAPDAEPELRQLTGGRNWMEAFGAVCDSTEFLGPISPYDFERLARLREALQEIADRDTLCNCEHDTAFCCAKVGHYCAFCIAATALNTELAHRKGEKS